MSVTVKIFTKHGGRPTLFQTREFDALPVTLGRDAVCTIALEDPLKHISRVHVELEEGEEGICWLSVLSKVNPVMVKGRRHGPGSRVPLESGDSFGMGDFEVQILFTEPERAPAPGPGVPATVSPVEKNPVVDIVAEEEPVSLAPQDIPPPEPGIFDEPTFIGGDEPTYMGPSLQATAKPTATVEIPSAGPAAASESSMQDAVRVLLQAAGIADCDLTPEQSEKRLRECGAILRVAVEGLMTLLIAHGEMRKAFQGQEGTKVAARETNPLKLMSQPQEAMEFLLDTTARSEGFLAPLPAITQAADDLRAHELAVMAGMRAAVLGALRRLDPKVLEKAFEKSGGGFSLGGRKARMWELFLIHQQKLAEEVQKDFNQVFGRDFMAGYEVELRRSQTGR